MKRATHFALRFGDSDEFPVPSGQRQGNFSFPHTHGENFSLRYARGEVFSVDPGSGETRRDQDETREA